MDGGGDAAADGGLKTPSRSKRPEEPETVTPETQRRREGDDHNAVASASAYDVIIPKIRKPNEKDIIAKFQF